MIAHNKTAHIRRVLWTTALEVLNYNLSVLADWKRLTTESWRRGPDVFTIMQAGDNVVDVNPRLHISTANGTRAFRVLNVCELNDALLVMLADHVMRGILIDCTDVEVLCDDTEATPKMAPAGAPTPAPADILELTRKIAKVQHEKRHPDLGTEVPTDRMSWVIARSHEIAQAIGMTKMTPEQLHPLPLHTYIYLLYLRILQNELCHSDWTQIAPGVWTWRNKKITLVDSTDPECQHPSITITGSDSTRAIVFLLVNPTMAQLPLVVNAALDLEEITGKYAANPDLYGSFDCKLP